MNLRLKIRFYTDKYSWLCFKHAIIEATHGVNVQTEIDDFDSEYYLGDTHCILCEKESCKEPK